MDLYEKVIRLLKKDGWTEDENISDYWFKHQFRLQPMVDQIQPGYSGIFSARIRWKSEIGEEFNKTIREFIQEKILERERKYQELLKIWKGWGGPSLAPVEFDFLLVQLYRKNGEVYTLDRFEKLFNSIQCDQGWANLCGIDLSGLNLNNCVFNNCMLSFSDFRNSKWQQIVFKDSFLAKVDFRNSYLADLIFVGESNMCAADITNAFINNINLESGMDYNKVSYRWLMLAAIKQFFGYQDLFRSLFTANHTVFISAKTTLLNDPQDHQFKKYVEWYQYVLGKIENISEYTLVDRFQFLIELLFTKYWTSCTVLAVIAVLINLLFAFLYYVTSASFKNLEPDFFSAFYYSVVTFTTLGYGDIYPETAGGKMFVIVEVITGYVTLGIFLFLISDKINKKF